VTEAAAHGCVAVAGGARPGLSCKAQNNWENEGDERRYPVRPRTIGRRKEMSIG
jgi:hypothetical protein